MIGIGSLLETTFLLGSKGDFHNFVKTSQQTQPITAIYETTQYGKTSGAIIDEIAKWRISYRNALHSSPDKETA